MDIQVEVESKLKKIIEDGTLSAIIEKQVTQTCTSIVQDLFRDYSDFGSNLKKVMKDKMQISLDNLSIDGFTTVVNDTVERCINGGLAQAYAENIKKVISETVNKLEKKEWKLSELVIEYYNRVKDLRSDGEKIDMEVAEPTYGSRWVRIGRKNTSSYSSRSTNWDVKMLVDEKTNEITGTWYEGKLTSPVLGKMWNHRIETLLMQLWVNSCTLEIDVTDIGEVEYPDEYNCND